MSVIMFMTLIINLSQMMGATNRDTCTEAASRYNREAEETNLNRLCEIEATDFLYMETMFAEINRSEIQLSNLDNYMIGYQEYNNLIILSLGYSHGIFDDCESLRGKVSEIYYEFNPGDYYSIKLRVLRYFDDEIEFQRACGTRG